MVEIPKILKDIFNNELDYKKINIKSAVKLREHKTKLQLKDLILFRLLYSKNETTKENAASLVNNKYDTFFSRQAYEGKENNIPIDVYNNILHSLVNFYNKSNTNSPKVIAIDGTYNNDIHMNEILNMGFYDVTNGIPIDIISYGKENKNKEIHCAIEYITKNITIFKKNIIVADRAYFSYKFLKFLTDNNIYYIVRAKGEAVNLAPTTKLDPKIKHHDIIVDIKKKSRIIKYTDTIKQNIFTKTKSGRPKKNVIEIQNNCVLVTNLPSENNSNDKILEFYRSRWDIEVFFKHLKSNFKFQHLKEKSAYKNNKMYICQLIIIYITKIIKTNQVINNGKQNIIYKVNNKHFINGIFNCILYSILDNSLDNDSLNKFYKQYSKVIQNKKNRSFARKSMTPFTKWYIKKYSDASRNTKIINAILTKKASTLNKNLKMIAKRIISINGKKVNVENYK